MSSDVVTVDPEDDVHDVIDRMLENKIGAVPVVDADQTLVGIISYVDVLRHLGAAS
jgi:acetoin utilization protein AcuB